MIEPSQRLQTIFENSIKLAKKLGHDIFFPIENCSNLSPTGPIDLKTGSPMRVKVRSARVL